MREAGLVEVIWLPFELHPEVPREGMARERVLPPEYIARVRRSMDAMAREVGLVMEPKDRLINTRLALATAEFARERVALLPVHHALRHRPRHRQPLRVRAPDLRRIIAEH